MGIEIELRYADGATQRRRLEEGRAVIGREAGDVVLGDDQVSSRHGELEVRASSVAYRDLGSTNGSYWQDGTRIQSQVELQPGSVVLMGGSAIVVQSVDPPQPAGRKGTMVMGSNADATPGAPGGASPLAGGPQPSSSAGAQPPPPQPPQPPAPQPPEPSPAAGSGSGQPPGQPPAAEPPQSPPQEPGPPSPGGGSGSVWDEIEGTPSSGGGSGSVWDFESDPGDPMAGGPLAPSATQAATTVAFPPDMRLPGQTGFDELKTRLTSTWALFEPHWKPLAFLIGVVTVPVGLLESIPIPLMGLIVAPLSFLVSLVMAFFLSGAAMDYVLRFLLGRPVTLGDSARAQLGRLLPWSVTAVIVGILGMIGFILLIVPGIMVTWAAYAAFLIEGKRFHEAPVRSAELFVANWKQVLWGILPLIGVGIAYGIAMAILSAIPFVGTITPLVESVATAVLMPFSAVYMFRLYFEVRRDTEGGDPVADATQNAPVA